MPNIDYKAALKLVQVEEHFDKHIEQFTSELECLVKKYGGTIQKNLSGYHTDNNPYRKHICHLKMNIELDGIIIGGGKEKMNQERMNDFLQ